MGNFNQNNRLGGRRDSMRPQMHSAICAECGNSCQVPFRPSGDRPIYCSKCFESKRNGDGGSRGSDRRNYDRPNFENKPVQPTPSFDSGKALARNNEQLLEQLTSINAKLDIIISALKPKVIKPSVSKKVAATKKTASKKSLSQGV